MTTIAELLIKIGVDPDGVQQGMDDAASFVDRNFGKITAAGVAAGAGMETFARAQQPVTRDLRKLAASTGISEDAMRDLVKETANVTFPLQDVIDVMEKGREQGLKSADQLQDFAQFWDMVGDATGENAVQLSEAGVALRAVGIAAGDESKALGAFGFISQETTQDVGEFLTFLERTGPELNAMGAGVDEAAAILGIMEHQFGMTGRMARQEFRTAVNEADGDMGKMLETLGISQGMFGDYMGAVSESSDVIERNAQLHAESFTPMQKLTHAAQEAMLQHGALADVAGTLAVPLMALGPASKLVTSGLGFMAKAAGVAGKAALGLFKILLANPFILIAAAVIALVVIVVKNWDTIVAAIRKGWDWITARFAKAVEWVRGVWDRMWGSVRSIADRAVNFVRGIPGRILDGLRALATTVMSFLSRWHPAAILLRLVQAGLPRLVGFVRSIPQRILSALGNLGSLLTGAGRALIDGLTKGIRSVISKPVDAVKGMVDKVRRFLPFSPAKEGPLAGRGAPDLAGAALVEMIADGMGSELSRLTRQAEQIAGAALPSLGVPSIPGLPRAAAQATGGDGAASGRHVSIHVDAPRNADEREIAQAIDDRMWTATRTAGV